MTTTDGRGQQAGGCPAESSEPICCGDGLERERLITALSLSLASSHAEKAQQQFVDRYNVHSRAKSFHVTESVLVLQKDSSASKVFSRWIGPGLITHVQSPNSYVVEFEDSSSRTIEN